MAGQSYNFFGLGPGQQQAPVDPNILALQAYNNPTSPNPQSSQAGGSGINPQALAKMMMANQSQTPAGVPSNAQSWNTGAGPLPWLPQNALPWSGS